MANYSTIQWACAGGGTTSSRIDGVTSGAALNTLALAIEGASNAAYLGYRIYTEVASPGTPVDATFQGKTDRATIVMKDASNDIVKLGWPAPVEAQTEFVNGKRVVIAATIETLRAAMSVATGKVLTAESSSFRSKNGK